MNTKTYNQIVDEVYDFYCKSFEKQFEIERYSFDTDPMTKIMFVEKIKNLDWFSETWGLKIEERELSLKERKQLYLENDNFNNPNRKDEWNSLDNIPTKLITITYKDETVEIYA